MSAALPSSSDPFEPWEVLDLLTSLVQKSLVVYEEDEQGQGRYRLLETVRQYSRDRLLEAGDGEAVRSRHLGFFLALAEEAEPKLGGPEQAKWQDRLEAEHDNLGAALDWSTEQGSPEPGLRLAGMLRWFWQVRGHLREGRQRLTAVLAMPGAESPTALRARALNGAGTLAWCQGDYAAARVVHEESLRIYQELGDRRGVAAELGALGGLDMYQGDYEAAQALYEESLAIRRELGERQAISGMLNNLGNVALNRGNHQTACEFYEESLAIGREFGNRQHIAGMLNNLGIVTYCRGEYGKARKLLEESVAINRELGNRQPMVNPLINLGAVALRLEEHETARKHFEESLRICREFGDQLHAAECLEGLAGVSRARAEFERAARLFGAAEARREEIGAPLWQWGRADRERSVDALREALGEAALTAAWAEGRALPIETAISYALGDQC